VAGEDAPAAQADLYAFPRQPGAGFAHELRSHPVIPVSGKKEERAPAGEIPQRGEKRSPEGFSQKFRSPVNMERVTEKKKRAPFQLGEKSAEPVPACEGVLREVKIGDKRNFFPGKGDFRRLKTRISQH